MFAHNVFHHLKYIITCAMTGEELCLRIVISQSVSQSQQFLFWLLAVEQMVTSYDFADGEGTGSKDVLQSAMSATCEQKAIDIQG